MGVSKKVAAILWGRTDQRCLGGGDAGALHRIEDGRVPVNPSSDGAGCKGGGAKAGGGVPQEEENELAPHSEAVRPAPAGGDDFKLYATGARRSHLAERYDLVPTIGLQRVALTMAEGAEKYGDGNWEKGFPVNDILNHALAHIFNHLSGDQSEDHLGHAAANLLMAIHTEAMNERR